MSKLFRLQKGDRVAILVQNLPVPFDRRVWQEARHLKSLGSQVCVVCPDSPNYPKGKFELEGIEVRRYKAPKEADTLFGYVFEYASSLFKLFFHLFLANQSGRIKVIQYCNPPDLLFLVAIPFKLFFRAKIIFDQHDLGPELMHAKGFSRRPFMMRFALAIEKMSYVTADHVISTNNSYKEKALTRGGKSSEDVFVVRSGPPSDWAQNVVSQPTYRQGHRYQLGYIGVMGFQDGVDLLLEAISCLVHEMKLDVYLVLAGGGTELENLKRLTSELAIENHVQFFGKISDDSLLRNLISSSDVCVAADRESDLNNLSTMNKIIEYMALAKPIALFESKESRFSAGDAALYATPDEPRELARAIQTLLLDENLRNELGNQGRQRFEQTLCWENQVNALRLAYWGDDLT